MCYLGVDQSLRSTGVSVVDEKACVRFRGTIQPGKRAGTVRLAYIRDSLRGILGGQQGLLSAAIEGYSMDSLNRPFDLGEVGGLVRLVLHDAQLPFVVVSPATLKLFVAGRGYATKEQMQQAVLKLWGVDFSQDDECDAFGLAQVARSFYLNSGTTRTQLEVLKKLKESSKKKLLS